MNVGPLSLAFSIYCHHLSLCILSPSIHTDNPICISEIMLSDKLLLLYVYKEK